MKYEEAKKLNDELTKITGVKHYPTIGEAFESVFKEKGIIDKNGNVVKEEYRGYHVWQEIDEGE